MSPSIFSWIRRAGFLMLLLAVVAAAASAKSRPDNCEKEDRPDYLVRSVKIEARWLPSGASLPLGRGDELTPEKLRDTRWEVLRLIDKETSKFVSELIVLGKQPISPADVKFVRAYVCEVPPDICEAEKLTRKCVDITVYPYALSTDPLFMASVYLPMPRSNRLSFLGGVPAPLRVLNPKFRVAYDRSAGFSPGFEISTDLLSLPDKLGKNQAEIKPVQLLLKMRASKSLDKSFYDSQTELKLSVRQPTKYIEQLGLETGFTARNEPHGTLRYYDNSVRIGGNITFNPAWGILNRVVFGGGYRYGHERLSGDALQPALFATENSYDFRTIMDGRIFDGAARASVWIDGSKIKPLNKSYRRMSVLIGYEKEIPVGDHTLGLEAIYGAGRASSDTPDYAQFFGGNNLNDFLYQETDSSGLNFMPSGPLLRGFGKNRAGYSIPGGRQSGATGYQHFNVTLSIPIPRWSYPLIPNEIVDDNPTTTLRDLVDFAVNSGEAALASSFEDDGLTGEEAEKKAKKLFNEIRPGMEFLTRYAKSYAVKPLLMFDTARITRFGINAPQTRYSVGAGVQVTITLAKFEVGYLYNINRFPGDKIGGFNARMVFQNIF